MWKIEKCYKIIFEAILEQEALKKICTEVGMYTNAGIAFINVAGNLVASSPVWRNCFPDSAEKKHLTLDTYNQYFGKKKLKDWSLQVTAVQAESKSVGYVLIASKIKKRKQNLRDWVQFLHRICNIFLHKNQNNIKSDSHYGNMC